MRLDTTTGDLQILNNSFLKLNSDDNNWKIGRSDATNQPFETQLISDDRVSIAMSGTAGQGLAIGYMDDPNGSALEIGTDYNRNPIVFINPSARVGIGTTAPGAALEVNGDIMLSKGTNRTISIPDKIEGGNADSLILQAANAVSEDGNGGDILLLPGVGVGSGVNGGIGIGTSDVFNILQVAGQTCIGANYAAYAYVAPTDGLLVEGAVGIGGYPTTAAKLGVNGNIQTTGQLMLGNIQIGVASSNPSTDDWKFKGCLYINTSDGKLRINTANDDSAPNWIVVGTQS